MQELKQHLQVIYERTPKNDSLFNWMDKATYSNAKLQKKFDNAIESYVGWEAIDIDKGEMYLFLFDDTVFGSAKEGFLITTKAIYFKEIAKSADKIEFTNASLATSPKKNKISIGIKELSLTMLNDATDSIVDILNTLIEYNSIPSEAELAIERSLKLSPRIAKKGGIFTVEGHQVTVPENIYDHYPITIPGAGRSEKGVTGYMIVFVDFQEDAIDRLLLWLGAENDEDGDAKKFLAQIEQSLEEVDKNVALLIDIAQNFFDYEFSDAGKYAKDLLKHIEPHVSTFGEYIKLARTIADEDYINDKTWAKEIFHKANDLAEGASSKLELAEAIYDYQKDEDWGRTLLKNFEVLADKNPNFDDYYSLGNMIVSDEYADDKSWAKEVYQKALDTNPASSDYIALCENIANDYYLNDKVWAKELIKKHIAFEDQVYYEKFIDIASMDDLLADEEFTKEIVQNAKEQCDGFDDYLKLFNNIDNGSRATLDMLVDVLIDTILVLETDEQKTQLVEAIEYTINKDTVEIVKTKSIAELKKMYGKKDENSFEGELELPPLDEIIASDEEQYSEAELIKWMGELTRSVLTFDNPIDEYNKGNYDGCISTLESLIEDSSLDKNTNEKYLASLKKHIETLKAENNASEELTLEIPSEPSSQQTNPSDLKTEYANKIASGEIDPIETSFADFEAASQNKEIDYKAVYSQMIGEGRIDPTETTYEEMIKVSKLFGGVDESEYKATYSKYIGSGEIDPSETTYDEIVNIASIFNEINGGGNSKDMMEEIYQYLMKNVNDDNDYLVGNFLELKEGSEESYDFASFAGEMYDFELGFEKIKYLLDRSYELAQSYDHYKDIANVIIDSNSPQEWNEWAKELYKESESKVESVDDILDLAYSIGNTLEDDDWTLDLYERAMNESKTFSEMVDTADAVSQFDGASKTWAKEIYQKAKGLAEEFEDFKTLTDNVSHDMYIGDKEWGKELFEEAKEKATDVSELQALIELLINDDNFDDQEYGKKLSYEALDKCNDFDEYILIVYGTSINQELQKEIILKVIAILETDEEKNKLCDEIEYSLEDDDQLKMDIQNLSVQELKSKYGKPSTEELKKLYAQGIGSGEIDPVEVSFDSFEKNYGNSNDNSSSISTEIKEMLDQIEKQSGNWEHLEDEDLQNTDFLKEWAHVISMYDAEHTKYFTGTFVTYFLEYEMETGSNDLEFEQHFHKNKGLQLLIEYLPQTFFNKMIDEMEEFRKAQSEKAIKERQTYGDKDEEEIEYLEEIAMAFENYQKIFKKHRE